VTRILLSLAAAVAGVAFTPAPVEAQPYGPRVGQLPPGPTVSPYLNLARRGTLPAINYYGLVRPQFDTYTGLQVLRQGILQTQAAVPTVADFDAIPTTGRPSGFLTHGVYFMTTGGPTAGRSSAVRGPVGTATPTATRYSRPAFR
jgi:hypothetical protein